MATRKVQRAAHRRIPRAFHAARSRLVLQAAAALESRRASVLVAVLHLDGRRAIRVLGPRPALSDGVSMRFFSTRVCTECAVHFERHKDTTNDIHWPNLCSVHLRPFRERFDRRRQVISWADANWEQLEKQMLEQREKGLRESHEKMQQYNQAAMSAIYNRPQYENRSPLGGLF
jgi:hypothetical protein